VGPWRMMLGWGCPDVAAGQTGRVAAGLCAAGGCGMQLACAISMSSHRTWCSKMTTAVVPLPQPPPTPKRVRSVLSRRSVSGMSLMPVSARVKR
jgi:hypothetical protein